MRFYCEKILFKYFEDYIYSLFQLKDKIILFDYNTKIILNNDGITNVFLNNIPTHLIEINFNNNLNNNLHIFILNTEQLSRDDFKKIFLFNFSKLKKLKEIFNMINIGILDYSIENFMILKKDLFNFISEFEIFHIPYQYNNNEIEQLIEYSKKKIYEISFINSITPYRNYIIQNLEKEKIYINKIIGWHDSRDIEIGKSKILLNLHINKDYKIFESMRCDRWIFAGKIIISDNCLYNELLDLKDFIIFEEYENIPNKCKEIIDNYDFYVKEFESKKNKLVEIIQNRKRIYDEFRKIFN